ncbi:hypothetical protein GCM10010145_56280 [Streptomyces ruber]|uniref:Peptidase n=2 Tax=Streptomyces TaxID=1883 RepID=A0A918BNE7_9ACTN|nr:Clp protease N-terminal domain-containing protein [Streptomyces ruber]GGQ79287.1 hypothetical protein GCM10010145_56280 [Streptomyces ruber]
MRHRLPRQAADGQGQDQDQCRDQGHSDGHGYAEPVAGLTDELAAVVTGARRRALRDGDRQIDTAHLLHALLDSDPEARAVFGDGPQAARLLGYLVQRSIGYGLRWQGTVEDSGALPVVTGATGWSPLAAGAMEEARARAERRGETRARGIDLLAALVAAPDARAVEVLRRAGVDAEAVTGSVARRVAELA